MKGQPTACRAYNGSVFVPDTSAWKGTVANPVPVDNAEWVVSFIPPLKHGPLIFGCIPSGKRLLSGTQPMLHGAQTSKPQLYCTA